MGKYIEKVSFECKKNGLHIGFRLKNFLKVWIMIFHAYFTEFGVNFVEPKDALGGVCSSSVDTDGHILALCARVTL